MTGAQYGSVLSYFNYVKSSPIFIHTCTYFKRVQNLLQYHIPVCVKQENGICMEEEALFLTVMFKKLMENRDVADVSDED